MRSVGDVNMEDSSQDNIPMQEEDEGTLPEVKDLTENQKAELPGRNPYQEKSEEVPLGIRKKRCAFRNNFSSPAPKRRRLNFITPRSKSTNDARNLSQSSDTGKPCVLYEKEWRTVRNYIANVLAKHDDKR